MKGWWNDRKETLIALLKGKKSVKQEISLLVEKRVGKRVISSVIGEHIRQERTKGVVGKNKQESKAGTVNISRSIARTFDTEEQRQTVKEGGKQTD